MSLSKQDQLTPWSLLKWATLSDPVARSGYFRFRLRPSENTKSPGGLSSSWASHALLLLASRLPSRRWESISGRSSLGSQSSKLISTPQMEWAPLGARMFSAGYSGVLQKTASERLVATCFGPLAHPHPPRMPEAH